MKTVKRLAEEFRPEHYILQLTPNAETLKFSGQVVISGHKTGRPSRRITLHQRGLKVTGAHLVHRGKKGEKELKVIRINIHKTYEEVRLHTTELIYPGAFTIALEFEGSISKAMSGIYPSNFKYRGKPKTIIATQFESHYAREAFPCIDEPDAKATFDLKLVTPKGDTVISNTPIKEQKPADNGLIETVFETTPKMSTYLLAFVIGQLGFKEAKTRDGVVVRAYATPDNVKFTDFALDVSVKCLEFYNDYFGIEYPLAKCDMIALPDFSSGAMENWGCITYREQALLVDPDHTSLSAKQYVAMVVAHELAHQWFGNLVTMHWWTDLWLNEGFASWIEYLAVDHIFPDWQMWTQFIVDEQQQALKLDALEHTHPVEVPVSHPDEIRSIFDTISYSKGSSVIHMLHEYLGPKLFQEGLSFYLSKHAYKNTSTVDLWAAMEEISDKPVKKFMQAWTAYSGFPLLRADVSEYQLDLTQSRFYLNASAAKSAKTTWPVPLLANQPEISEIFETKSLSAKVKDTRNLKLNWRQSGFYRVVYNSTHLQHLAEQIKEGKLKPIDRLGLLADQFEAAKAGFISTDEVLQFMEIAYKDEDNAAVWDVISGTLANIRVVMDDEQLRELMQPYVQELTRRQLQRLGWKVKEGESHFDRLLRPTILGMASVAEEPSVVREALRQFHGMRTPNDIEPELRSGIVESGIRRGADVDPDLRGVVYGTAVRHGNEAEFNKLVKMHALTHLSEERNVIASAITGFKQPELIRQALKLIKTDTVRLQDAGHWIVYSFMNRFGKHISWQWLKDSWGWLEKDMVTDMSFTRMPIYAARAFSDPSFLPEFKKFFEPKRTPALNRAIDQGIETIEWHVAWRQRDLELLKAYFKKYKA